MVCGVYFVVFILMDTNNTSTILYVMDTNNT